MDIFGGMQKMTTNIETKKLAVDSTVSLKGIVRAIFNDTVHIQIGEKIIAMPITKIKP